MFDGDGNRMTPTHANKNGKRYRYYISRSLATGTRNSNPAGMRIPAREIENLVSQRLMEFFNRTGDLVDVVKPHMVGSKELKQVIEDAANLADEWPRKSPAEKRSVFIALIQRIDIRDKTTSIHLSVNHLCKLLQKGLNDCPAAKNISPKEQPLALKVDFDLKRCGLGMRMLINGNPAGGKTELDMKLIRLIAKAHRINQKLTCSDGSGNSGLRLSDIAKEEGYSGSYATRLLRLAFLSPKITTAILNGRQSAEMTPATLMRDTKYPIDWQQQLKIFKTDLPLQLFI